MMEKSIENYPSKPDDGVTIISSEEKDKYQDRFSGDRCLVTEAPPQK